MISKELKKYLKKIVFSCVNLFKPTYVINYTSQVPQVIQCHKASLNLSVNDIEFLNYQKLFPTTNTKISVEKNVEIKFFKNVIVDVDNGVAMNFKKEIIVETLKYPKIITGTYLSKPTAIKKIEGNIIVINPALNAQYFHIWFDGLVKLFYLSKLNIEYKIVIYDNTKEIYKKVIQKFANQYKIEIVNVKNSQYIKVDNYIVIRNVLWAKHSPYFNKEMNIFFTSLFKDVKSNKEFPTKIYIKRKSNGRGIKNEIEIEALFVNKGFELVCLEELTLEEQFILFNNAEVIAGLHGAGFTNLIFSSPSLKVIELQNFAVVPTYYFLSKQLDLDYHPVLYKNYNHDVLLNPENNSKEFYKQKLKSVAFNVRDIETVLDKIDNK